MYDLEKYYRTTLTQEGYDLFAVFSRFEYAMKKGGFRRENVPDAAWRSFADALPDNFFQSMQAAPEVQIYFKEPPDHLVCNDANGVDWSKEPLCPTNARELFDSIKVARNNLFHGDKGHNRQRDTELMKAALFVLNAAYESAENHPGFEYFVSEMEYGL